MKMKNLGAISRGTRAAPSRRLGVDIHPSMLCLAAALGALGALGASCAAGTPVRWVSTPAYEADYDKAWQLVIGIISEDFDIATVERDSGYVRTAWKKDSLSTAEAVFGGYQRAAVRITCKVESRKPFKLKVKAERGAAKAGEGGYPHREAKVGLEKDILARLKGRLSRIR